MHFREHRGLACAVIGILAACAPGPAPATSPTVAPSVAALTFPPCVTPTPLPPGYEGTSQPPCIPVAQEPWVYSRVLRFEADPQTIAPGDPITLRWETTAQQVSICQRQTVYDFGQCREGLPPSGTTTLTSDVLLTPSTIFDLLAVPPASDPVSSLESHFDARLVIPHLCPHEWFFPDALPGSCPLTPASVGPGLAQTFEHGLMIEVLATRQVIILLDDGGFYGGLDTWTLDMPETDPALVPPQGLYQPVRGLGLVWRLGSDPRRFPPSRDALGWATAPQTDSQTDYQCDWGVYSLNAPNEPVPSNCWLLGPDGRVFVLWSDPVRDRYGWEEW